MSQESRSKENYRMHGHLDEPDLAELASRLDELGESERRAAPGDLETRLIEAVRGAGPGEPAAPLRLVAAAAPVRAARRIWSPVAMAAAVALMVTAGAVWLSGRGVGPSTGGTELAAVSFEQDVTRWLDLTEDFGAELDAELAAVSAEAARLSSKRDDASAGLESLLEEGSL